MPYGFFSSPSFLILNYTQRCDRRPGHDWQDTQICQFDRFRDGVAKSKYKKLPLNERKNA